MHERYVSSRKNVYSVKYVLYLVSIDKHWRATESVGDKYAWSSRSIFQCKEDPSISIFECWIFWTEYFSYMSAFPDSTRRASQLISIRWPCECASLHFTGTIYSCCDYLPVNHVLLDGLRFLQEDVSSGRVPVKILRLPQHILPHRRWKDLVDFSGVEPDHFCFLILPSRIQYVNIHFVKDSNKKIQYTPVGSKLLSAIGSQYWPVGSSVSTSILIESLI